MATDMLLVAMPEDETAGGTVLTSDSVHKCPRRISSTAPRPRRTVPAPGCTMARAAPKTSAVANSETAATR